MSNKHEKFLALDTLIEEKGSKIEALSYLLSLPPLKYIHKLAEGLQQEEFSNYLVRSHYNNICGIPACILEVPAKYKKLCDENLRKYYNLKDALSYIVEGKGITEFKIGEASDLRLNFALVDRYLINKLIQDISKEDILINLKNHKVRSIFCSEFSSSFFLFNYSISARIQCCSELLDKKTSMLFANILQQEINQRTYKYIAPINAKINQPLLNLLRTGLIYLENEDDEKEVERFHAIGGTKIELLRKPNREIEKIKDLLDGQRINVKPFNPYQNVSKSNIESKKFLH